MEATLAAARIELARGGGSYDGFPMMDQVPPSGAATGIETVIGLEVHVQLKTDSKMFCRCPGDYASDEPNTRVCPVCLGMPGALPVINQRAVEWTVKTALALGLDIPEESKFDRKNYPYPDLMKGYQISQYDLPLSVNGHLNIEVDGERRHIRILRIHLEEDTARLRHRVDEAGEKYSLVDVNRSGLPLMEIVSEPDMRSPAEARAYLVALRQILRYLDVSTANMEEGSFRCDANISLRPKGSETLGAKVEIKNMNSFRSVYKALQFEAERQSIALRKGESIVQETRGWVEDEEVTVSQRSKEHAHDYRYFPEPDLPPLRIDPAWVEEMRSSLPELPEAKRERFAREYGLGDFDVEQLTEEQIKADYYEQALAALDGEASQEQAKAIANWMNGELARLMNHAGESMQAVKIRPEHLAELVSLIEAGTISNKLAKSTIESMYETGKPPRQIVEESGQTQISGAEALRAVVAKVLAEQPQAVADYRAGKEESLKYLVGQVMKTTRGRANPQEATRHLQTALADAPT